MRACREARRIRDAVRSRNAKRRRRKGLSANGSLGWMDDPGYERLIQNSKRRYRRVVKVCTWDGK